jgi:hypothetical protein
MASDAGSGDADVPNADAGRVTGFAFCERVLPDEWKTSLLMSLLHVGHQPSGSGVTTGAVGSQLSLVNIRVARLTGILRSRKSKTNMARAALDGFVRAGQWKSCRSVIEGGIASHSPRVCRMAGTTRGPDCPVRGCLRVEVRTTDE